MTDAGVDHPAATRPRARRPASRSGRWWRARLRRGDLWAVAAIVVATTALHAWWIVRYRTGTGLSTDEGRLLLEAVPYQRFHPVTFLRQWRAPGEIAPLALALAGPFLGTGARLALAPLTVLPWTALLVVASWDLGRRLGGRWAGVLAAAIVATLPATVWWSRVFELIVPGAALWTLTMGLLVASDRLRRPWWAVAAGTAFGVGLLARSMLIGFTPVLAVLVAACVLSTWTSPGDALRRVASIAIPAAAVASTWWLLHAGDALRYLTGTSSNQRAGRSLWDQVGTERFALERITAGSARLLLAMGLVAATAGAVHAVSLAVPRARGVDVARWRGPATLGLSAAGVLAGWAVWGTATLVAGAAGVAGAVLSRRLPRLAWSSPRVLAVAAAGGTFTTLALTGVGFEGFELVTLTVVLPLVASMVGVHWLRWTAVPLVAAVALQSASFLRADAGWYQQQLRQEGTNVPHDRPLPADQRRWMAAAIAVDRWADRTNPATDSPVVVVTNDLFFAGSQLGAVNRATGGSRVYATVDDVRPSLDPGQGGIFARAHLGVSADPANASRAAAARAGGRVLRELGFTPVRRVRLPDGRRATLWSR